MVCEHMHVCMCMGMCVQEYMHIYVLVEAKAEGLIWFHPTLYTEAGSLIWTQNSLVCLASFLQGSMSLQETTMSTWHLCGCRGSELWSSCLHIKCFTRGPTSLTLNDDTFNILSVALYQNTIDFCLLPKIFLNSCINFNSLFTLLDFFCIGTVLIFCVYLVTGHLIVLPY